MSAPPSDASRRDALLDQLRYLLAELDALEPVLERLPADVLTASLPGERSVFATFAHLAALDREVHLDRLRRLVAEDEPVFEEQDPDGVEREVLGAALTDARSARETLGEAFERLPAEEWSRTGVFPGGERRDVYGFAFAVTQRDAAELRRLAYRLHESKLTDRAIDLPK